MLSLVKQSSQELNQDQKDLLEKINKCCIEIAKKITIILNLIK
jgi:hypothetical protein